jgi:dienelactone hydrolase
MSAVRSATNIPQVESEQRMASKTKELMVCLALFLVVGHTDTAHSAGNRSLTILRTPGGMRFGLLGSKPSQPAPTLFVFATDLEQTLSDERYVQVGRLLQESHFLIVSLDVPCHGEDRRKDEPEGIAGWRFRLESRENFLVDYVARASSVLDFLIQERYTNPGDVSASGTSRGGFIALHFAANDSRVKRVAAFAPVTNLAFLKEFESMLDKSLLEVASLSRVTDKFVGRPIWITIGNRDDRVGTGGAIAFMKQVVDASALRETMATIELHIRPSVGHKTPSSAHEGAARWFLSRN